MMKSKLNNHAQQIIEYILLFVAVVAVLVVFVGPGGIFRQAVNRTLDISLDQINVVNFEE